MATIYIAKTTTDLTGLLSDGCDLIFAEGEQDIVDGMNQSGLTEGAHTIKSLYEFAGNIGTAASPFRIDVDQGSSPKMSLGQSRGRVCYYPGGDNTLCSKLEALGGVELILCTGGTVTDLEIGGTSTAYIPDVVAVTNIRMEGGQIEQRYSATANSEWHLDGGIFQTGRGLAGSGIIASGAEVTVAREDTSATLPTQTTGTLYVIDGLLKWRGGGANLIVLGKRGRVDMSEAPNDMTYAIKGTARALARSALDSKYATLTKTVTEYVGSRTALGPSLSGLLGFGG